MNKLKKKTKMSEDGEGGEKYLKKKVSKVSDKNKRLKNPTNVFEEKNKKKEEKKKKQKTQNDLAKKRKIEEELEEEERIISCLNTKIDNKHPKRIKGKEEEKEEDIVWEEKDNKRNKTVIDKSKKRKNEGTKENRMNEKREKKGRNVSSLSDEFKDIFESLKNADSDTEEKIDAENGSETNNYNNNEEEDEDDLWINFNENDEENEKEKTELLRNLEDTINRDEYDYAEAEEEEMLNVSTLKESKYNINLAIKNNNDGEDDEDEYINRHYLNDVDDILKVLEEENAYGEVKKQMQKLKNENLTVQRPLGLKKQQKLDRITKYGFAKNDIKKWLPQIIRNQETEQLRLGFEDKENQPTMEDLSSTFSVSTDFEKELNDAILMGNLTEKNFDENENLSGQNLNNENSRNYDQERKEKIRKLKALMFREQRRSRRLNKIKSKMWHKMQNKTELKEREKLLTRLQAEDPDLAAELREQYERKRAQIRMLKQQTARKKWAKMALRFGGKDAQKTVTEQAQKEHDERCAVEKIAKQAPGSKFYKGSDDEGDSSDTSEEEEEDDEGMSPAKISAQAKMAALKAMQDSDEPVPETGLFNLNFMKNAMEKKREETKKRAEKILDEIERTGCDRREAILRIKDDYERMSDEDESDDDEKKTSTKNKKKEKIKKLPQISKAEIEAASALLDSENKTDDSFLLPGEADMLTNKTKKGKQSQNENSESAEGKKKSHKKAIDRTANVTKQIVKCLHSNSTGNDTNNHILKGTHTHANKHNEYNDDKGNINIHNNNKNKKNKIKKDIPEEEEEVSYEETEINSNNPQKNDLIVKKYTNAKNTEEKENRNIDDFIAAASEQEDKLCELSELYKSFETDISAAQKEIIREAFVTGTQEEEFIEEKNKDENGNGEQNDETLSAMPGWGDWTGVGTVRRTKKRINKNNSEKTAKKREDYKKHVTINDTPDRKIAKYYVQQTPKSFSSQLHYEMSLVHPMGPEWNTLPTFDRLIQPKVNVRIGAVVPPIEYVKHLPKEQIDTFLDAFDHKKKTNRTFVRL